MYAEVCSVVPCFLKESPEDALGCYRFVSVFLFLFNACFEVGEFSYVFVLFGGICLICGHVRRPPSGVSASSNAMSGVVSPSTTALAALSDVSLYSTSVCYLTFSMCIFSCLESLSFRIWFVRWRRSLYSCWL